MKKTVISVAATIMVLFAILLGWGQVNWQSAQVPEDRLVNSPDAFEIHSTQITEPLMIEVGQDDFVEYKGCKIIVSDIRQDEHGILITLKFKNVYQRNSGKILWYYNEYDRAYIASSTGTVTAIYNGTEYKCKKMASGYCELVYHWQFPYSENMDFKLELHDFIFTTYERV